ncbi:hypothetical protein [Streptomyces acidicola]|uniref:hypothetical protein n=1 Tax=Streptomyces acidicola TaxID=2596892 RepID=UPI00344469A8
MGAGWVAGVTRARALRTRCLDADGVRNVAGFRSLDDACPASSPTRNAPAATAAFTSSTACAFAACGYVYTQMNW